MMFALRAWHASCYSVGTMARVARRWVLLLAGALAAGCLSPTLPLPPPSKPTVEGPDEQGNVTLDGFVEGDAVYAANMQTGEIRGQFVGSDGHYRFALPAEVGNDIELWYSVSTQTSPVIVFTVPAPKP
jgi:hypothetical protein